MKNVVAGCAWLGALASLALQTTAGEDKIPLTRNWTDATGRFSVVAELLEVTPDAVRLKKEDGRVISVPIAQLSENDRHFVTSLKDGPEKAGKEKPLQPPEVEKFLKAVEANRPLDIKRQEQIIESLKKQLAEAKRTEEMAEAKRLVEEMKPHLQRLQRLQSGKMVIPELQTGTRLEKAILGVFDDAYVFSLSEVLDDQTMVVSPAGQSASFKNVEVKGLGKYPIPVNSMTTGLPPFMVRGVPTVGLRKEKDLPRRGSSLDRLIRDRVFEVVGTETRGHQTLPVLTPFDMRVVNEWMRREGRLPVGK